MSKNQSDKSNLRLAELLATLSLAIDLGLGQPLENFLRGCLLAVRLGEAAGFSQQDLIETYYLALVRFVGCTAESSQAVAIFGNDVAANIWLMGVEHSNKVEMLGALLLNHGKDQALPQRFGMVLRALSVLPFKATEVLLAHCEVGQRLAENLSVEPGIKLALGQIYERWDGRGMPGGLRGEQIALCMRTVQIAHDVTYLQQLAGTQATVGMVRQRASKGAYDPQLAERFCQEADRLLEEPYSKNGSLWEAVLSAEPGTRPYLSQSELDTALQAVADFVDLKSPYLAGHSRGVAALAAATAHKAGLPLDDVEAVRRAGWVHDLGRVAISSGIWDKPGPLTEGEWEQVRLHPYYTERILARSKTLAQLGLVATLHHERIDGSGYYRGVAANQLSLQARVLAAADIYQAMLEPRPYRQALQREEAAKELRRLVRAGRLDGEVVDTLLQTAGHRTRSLRPKLVAGLSEREVEVLRLIVRGKSNRQMATQLHLSERTVHHHVEHIYTKLGISTRAAATLFAMQNHLLNDFSEAESDDAEK